MGDGWTDVRTYGHTDVRTNGRKLSCVLKDIIPFGSAAQKGEGEGEGVGEREKEIENIVRFVQNSDDFHNGESGLRR